MKELFIYFLQVQIGIALLYLVYWLLLNKNTALPVKRFYLFGSVVIAFILPFIEFAEPATNNLNPINIVFDFHEIEPLSKLQFLPNAGTLRNFNQFNGLSIALSIYLIISALYLSVVFYDLNKLRKSIKTNKKVRSGKINFVINESYKSPFSFFNFIFTKSVQSIEKTPEYVHEMAHVQQLHSIDRLLVELSIPLLWVNPFIYLIRKSMIEVHEHLADLAVIGTGVEPIDYQKYLYLQLKSCHYLKMTSNFNYSLTKKRIMMISKNISIKKSIVRTLLSAILVIGIFVFYGFNNRTIQIPNEQIKSSEQVIPLNFSPSILPLKEGGEYWIGSHYGMRKHPISGTFKMHNGIDIVAATGTEVIAPADGLIIESEWKEEYGNRIKIKHEDKFVTVFAHLSRFNIKVGDFVKTKDIIGYVGSTGLATRAHLHYEIQKLPSTDPITYLNPADYIKNIKAIPEKEKNK